MSNAERLQANNQKLKTIEQTLKNKMISAGSNVVWTKLEDGSFRLEITSGGK